MFCTKCGTKIQDGSNFCGSCGTRVTSAPVPQQQGKNIAPAANAYGVKRADFTPIEATVAAYIGSNSEKAFRFGSLGRNDGVSLLNWIEQYADSGNCKGVELYLYPPLDNVCKLAAVVLDNDDEFVEGRKWGMDYSDKKPIEILFGAADADDIIEVVEFDGHDCRFRYIPFI